MNHLLIIKDLQSGHTIDKPDGCSPFRAETDDAFRRLNIGNSCEKNESEAADLELLLSS